MVFAGQDAWRKHPMVTNCYKRPFPGFGIALAIFTGYCILDRGVKFVARESICLSVGRPDHLDYSIRSRSQHEYIHHFRMRYLSDAQHWHRHQNQHQHQQ